MLRHVLFPLASCSGRYASSLSRIGPRGLDQSQRSWFPEASSREISRVGWGVRRVDASLKGPGLPGWTGALWSSQRE